MLLKLWKVRDPIYSVNYVLKIQTILFCFRIVNHSEFELGKLILIQMECLVLRSHTVFNFNRSWIQFKHVFLLSITGRVYEGLDDPLHAYITGATAEDVQSAVKKITDLVNLHVYNPESEQVCQNFK